MRRSWILLLPIVATPALCAELPKPTGPHLLGRSVRHWVDSSRPEPLSEQPGARRELSVWLWYPAESGSKTATGPYLEALDRIQTVLLPDQVKLVRSISTHTVAEAIPSAEPLMFPVLVFSPGAEPSPGLYTAFSEELASRGYVVAAIDHPFLESLRW